MTSIAYRCADATDAAIIADFQIAMAVETEGLTLDRSTCVAGINAVFHDSSLGRYFVAASDQRIIASALITYEWSDWRNGIIWWLQSVYVVPQHRGRGVFRGLYEYVRQQAANDAAVRGIRLYVDRRNHQAQEVYRRLGMNGDHYQVFEWMKEA